MRISKIKLKNKSQTAHEMYRLINQYFNDIDDIYVNRNGRKIPVSQLSIQDFFDMVKNIPYLKDTAPVEIIKRPIYVHRSMAGDCKKKSILMGAFFKKRGIPYRLIGSSKKKNGRIHHVFPQAKINGKWRNMDATYNNYSPGQPKIVTRAEIL